MGKNRDFQRFRAVFLRKKFFLRPFHKNETPIHFDESAFR